MNELRNRKDLMLMTYLRRNARENLTMISRRTQIPVSTIFDKLKDFEKKIITKHTTLIDFKKLGFDIRINMLLKIPKNFREEFREFIMTNENINSISRITNGYDYLIEGIFRDMNDLQRFSELLERFNIESKQELFILEDLKREGFLSDDTHTRLLLN